MSAISGTVGAVLGSKSAKKTAEMNLQSAREQNAANYKMFQEGRGSTGHAMLPMFFGDQEQNLANDATAYYGSMKNLLGTPQDQLNKYNDTIGQYDRSVAGARGALDDVFNGNNTAGRVSAFQPVAQARTAAAANQKQGVLEGLQQRINAMNADSARKGYSGSGSFAQNRLLGSTMGARQQAAGVMSMADLANATDLRDIQDQGQALKLQMLNQPFQQAQGALAMQMMPLNQVQQNFTRQTAPFDFFRMSPQSYQNAPLPETPYGAPYGQMAMNSLGSANQAIGNYFGQQGMADKYRTGAYQQMADYYGQSLPSNFGGLSAGSQGNYMKMLNSPYAQYNPEFE